ncbi:hypothetical protein RoseRS_0054 [Roseiflexus sp. RS-1]|nr:hypothetical protein RoseRS_0054 [Roseiflexus sp. RS-1]
MLHFKSDTTLSLETERRSPMFTKNEGSLDRGIRAVVGVLALIAGFTMLSGVWQIVAGVVGLVLLATAAIGICPLYSVLGINTCPVKPAERR